MSQREQTESLEFHEALVECWYLRVICFEISSLCLLFV